MRKPPRSPDTSIPPAQLAEVMQDRRYWDAASRFNQQYRHWAKVRYLARAEGLEAEPLWAIMKAARRSQFRPVPLTGEGQETLRYTLPDLVQQELMLVDQQLAGRLVAPDEQPISSDRQERFIISALREEAIASSMLEGAVTTRQDAKELLQTGRPARTRGERMVLNNYRAISFIRENRTTPLTPEFIIEVQRILTVDTLDNATQVGRLRTPEEDVYVGDEYGEVYHMPPPVHELPQRLADLCRFANDQAALGFMHPVIKACILHFQMGFDHPFADGNGRTARALFYWSMLRSGYWLFEYLPISVLIYRSPSKYALAYLYSETDEFDVTYFLVYKARIIARARRELGEYIGRKQKEMADARSVFESDHRLNHRQRDVIIRLLRSPYLALSIQDHQGRHNIAYGTARSDLLSLQTWGYVRMHQEGKRFIFVRGPNLVERAN
jgi:Fic family protein